MTALFPTFQLITSTLSKFKYFHFSSKDDHIEICWLVAIQSCFFCQHGRLLTRRIGKTDDEKMARCDYNVLTSVHPSSPARVPLALTPRSKAYCGLLQGGALLASILRFLHDFSGAGLGAEAASSITGPVLTPFPHGAVHG